VPTSERSGMSMQAVQQDGPRDSAIPPQFCALRVAYLAGTLATGGAERELVNQVKALAGSGHSVKVFSLDRGQPLEEELRAIGLTPVWVGRHPSRLVRLMRLTKALLRDKPDIIHSQHFYTNLYSAVAGRIARVVSFGSVQNDVWSEMASNGMMGRPSLSWVQWMTANSRKAIDNAVSLGYSRRRIFYLPNAVDLTHYTQAGKQTGSSGGCQTIPPVVLCIGRLVKQKRVDRFLQIVKQLASEGVKFRADIIGTGPLQQSLEAEAKLLGLNGRVRFLGQQSDIPRLLSDAQVVVLCSDHEGMPNVVLEAMAAGVPVVAANIGAVPDLIAEGVDGFLVASHDVRGFVARIKRLLADRVLWCRISQAARDKAGSRFSIKVLAARLGEVYAEALSG
jgi:glycosyltransferase involved in cell wall biosynthesis